MTTKSIGQYTLVLTDVLNETKKTESDILVQGSYKTNYIPSVNTQYIIRDSRKILDPKIVNERKLIWQHLASSGYKRNCIPDSCKLIVEFGFYVNHSINLRDLDNMIKSNLDLLATYFKFNDNRIYELSCYKRLLLHSEKELVHFRIRQSDLNEKTIDSRLLTL